MAVKAKKPDIEYQVIWNATRHLRCGAGWRAARIIRQGQKHRRELAIREAQIEAKDSGEHIIVTSTNDGSRIEWSST